MEPITPRICPSCGYEYEDWVEVCPDCNMPVESKRAKLQVVKGELDSSNPQWTVVGNVPNAIIGNLIKSQLEDAGIPVLLMRSTSVDVAEFSHNDYVPHDLRVPRSKLREARQLIDSPPDADPFGALWDDFSSDAEEEIEIGGEDARSFALDEGWSVLPAETDRQARQSVKRASEQEPEGWYWSDRRDDEVPIEKQGLDPYWQSLYDRSTQADPDLLSDEAPRSKYGKHHGAYSRVNDPYSPSKWIRIIYAILMLAMSLPFILSLLQNFWTFGK